MVVLRIYELINVKSYVDGKLSVAFLKALAMDSKLNGVWKSPTNVALLEAKCSQELQCELLVGRLLDGKNCVPFAKGNEMSDLCS